MGAWLKGELGRVLDRILSPQALDSRGFFNSAEVARLVADHRANREDYTDALIALLNFEIWARLFLDGRSHEDVTTELQGLLA